MPIISAFPTGESTVDYTGPKSGLPSLEEGKVAYVTDEKRLYTGNADGTNTQIPNADDLSAHISNKENPHGVTAEQVGAAAKDLSNVQLGLAFETATLPSSEYWDSVCYGNGKFVAVARNSTKAAYSTDGITWTAATLPSSGYWWSVCYGNGKFVAVARNSTKAAYSTDGITWTAATLPSSGYWNSVCYGNGKFVAVAGNSNKAAYTDASPSIVEQLSDSGLAKKRDIASAITSAAPSACKVTLTASGWDSTAKTQSATVSGVLEDESKQLIMPMPAGTSMSAYNEAGIQMTAQGDNSVTFTADTVPKVDVEVWVVVQAVNDVTPPTLDQASWDYISKQSLAGNAKNLWAVGDCKKIKLSGAVGTLSLNTELYVYILDFDHDSSTAGGTKDGITFGTFKTALTGGKDICLDDSAFVMNPYPNTNSGGWKNSEIRYNVLGSTNVQNGDATATTATSPKADTVMSCLPADLRAVMRPMCIYTDNTGGGSDTESYVTATIDFLPLLAEFEIHGARTHANSAEQNNQAQYAYFKNGNPDDFDVDNTCKVKYQYTNQSMAMDWLCRSPNSTDSTDFCCVSDAGEGSHTGASLSNGVAPMFKV